MSMPHMLIVKREIEMYPSSLSSPVSDGTGLPVYFDWSCFQRFSMHSILLIDLGLKLIH